MVGEVALGANAGAVPGSVLNGSATYPGLGNGGLAGCGVPIPAAPAACVMAFCISALVVGEVALGANAGAVPGSVLNGSATYPGLANRVGAVAFVPIPALVAPCARAFCTSALVTEEVVDGADLVVAVLAVPTGAGLTGAGLTVLKIRSISPGGRDCVFDDVDGVVGAVGGVVVGRLRIVLMVFNTAPGMGPSPRRKN